MKKATIFFVILTYILTGNIYAQKYCDLSISTYSPAFNAIIPYGDTIKVTTKITNNGPDDITITDTFRYFVSLGYNRGVVVDIPSGGSYVDTFLTTWADGPDDETFTFCVNLAPNPIGFTDTVPSNDSTCFSMVLKGSNSVGIQNIENKNIFNLEISPNPATDYIHVDLPQEPSKLQIVNVMGQIIYESEYRQSNIKKTVELKVENYPSGIYFINLKTEQALYTGKFIKN